MRKLEAELVSYRSGAASADVAVLQRVAAQAAEEAVAAKVAASRD